MGSISYPEISTPVGNVLRVANAANTNKNNYSCEPAGDMHVGAQKILDFKAIIKIIIAE